MKSIREAAARTLTWKLMKDTYELRSGAELFATLRWQKGSLFLGEAAEGRWTFKRMGFLRPKVTVRSENSSTDLATLAFSGSGGRLEFPDDLPLDGEPSGMVVEGCGWGTSCPNEVDGNPWKPLR